MKKAVLLAIALSLATASVPAATLEVEVVDGRDFMVAFSMNNDMRVCGDNQINSTTTAVVWEPLVGATILPGADGISQAGDITRSGDVVGWFESAATGTSTAVVWYADSGYQAFTEIGVPTEVHTFTQGYTMNDDGLVALMAGRAQYIEPGENPSGLAQDAYLWSSDKGFVEMRHLSVVSDSFVADMNDRGDVVGESVALDGSTHAVICNKSGRVKDLGIPAGETSSTARAINDHGLVVGHDTAFNSDSWVWTKQDGFTMLQDFGFASKAVDVNNHGIVVGTADVFPFDPAPVVWDADGNLYDIRDLMFELGYYMTDGVAINDNNEIVAYGINFQTGRRQAIVIRLTFVD